MRSSHLRKDPKLMSEQTWWLQGERAFKAASQLSHKSWRPVQACIDLKDQWSLCDKIRVNEWKLIPNLVGSQILSCLLSILIATHFSLSEVGSPWMVLGQKRNIIRLTFITNSIPLEATWLVVVWNGNLMQRVVMSVFISDQIFDILGKCNQKYSDSLFLSLFCLFYMSLIKERVMSKMILRKFYMSN